MAERFAQLHRLLAEGHAAGEGFLAAERQTDAEAALLVRRDEAVVVGIDIDLAADKSLDAVSLDIETELVDVGARREHDFVDRAGIVGHTHPDKVGLGLQLHRRLVGTAARCDKNKQRHAEVQQTIKFLIHPK